MLKIIIAGSREFTDYDFLRTKLDNLLKDKIVDGHSIEIVCGVARGADLLGERYAKERNFDVKYFKANWDSNGRGAGFIRNIEMANYGTHLVAFQVNESKGTQHMIDQAKKRGLEIRVFKLT